MPFGMLLFGCFFFYGIVTINSGLNFFIPLGTIKRMATRSEVLNLHLYASPVTHESRILRMTKVSASLQLFDAIEIVGYREIDLPLKEAVDQQRAIVRLPSLHRLPKLRGIAIFRYLYWYLMILLHYAPKKVGVIHSNGVEDLIPAVLLKMVHPGSKLIYDAHELETERSGWSKLNKQIASWVESAFIRKADAVFVVSGLIGQWYRERYNLENVHLVRNIADRYNGSVDDTYDIRRRINAVEDELIFLYQGAFFEGRGLEVLVSAFLQLPMSYRLVLLGYGRMEAVLKDQAKGADNIHFLPPAHPDEILSYTVQADIGLCLIEDTCLSYRYCLPNKLFEYIQAGLPVLVSDLPELAGFVKRNACGWQVSCSPEPLRAFALGLDKSMLAYVKSRIPEIADQNSWHREKEVVESVYTRLNSEYCL